MRRVFIGTALLALMLAPGCDDSSKTASRLDDMAARLARAEESSARASAEAAVLRESAASLARELALLREQNESLRKEMSALRESVSSLANAEMFPQYDAKPVVKLLGHSNPNVKASAAQILRYMADPASIEPLIALAASRADPSIRASAVQALAGFKDERVEKALVGLLAEQDQTVRRAVYQTMGQVASEAMLDPLLAAMEEEMKRPAPGGGYNYDLQLLIGAVANFQSLKAGQALLKIVTEGDAQSSRYAAQSLYRFKNRELSPEIIAYLDKAPEAAPSDGDPPQRHLIGVLQNMQETRAGAVMVKLLGSPNQNVRQAAAGALSTLADAQAVPALAKAFESGQAPGGRPMASQDMIYIAQALERLGDGRACRALLAQVGNANQQVAYAAARGLSRCVDFECTADIIKAYSACGDNSVKNFLKSALSSGLYPARWIENDQAFVVDAERLDWLRKNKDKIEPARERDKAQENF